jgi:hypothetical protein
MLHICNFSDADAYIQAIKKMIDNKNSVSNL